MEFGDGGGTHRARRAVGLANNEHHADERLAAERASPFLRRSGGTTPQGHGAGGAETAMAALDEDRVGLTVHAEVARLHGVGGLGVILIGEAWYGNACVWRKVWVC